MKELFADLPEAIENTMEIANKCEKYTLASDILLPAFDIPEEFQDPKDLEDGGKRGENNYLRHLTYEGAKKRYPEITEEIDRKSTRLNSSHVRISYAVFCLKKKKKKKKKKKYQKTKKNKNKHDDEQRYVLK